jgi:hypothetical protein
MTIFGRRWALGAILAFNAGAMRASADDIAVPVSLQAELMVKVAAYDRSFASRAGPRVRVLIVTEPGSGESERVAAQMMKALSGYERIAGLPHDEETIAFASAAQIARVCREKRAAIVYFSASFRDRDVSAIVEALAGVDVLSVSADPVHVPRGLVLGFDLVSGKPRLLVHLGQAKRQNVEFKAEVLKLMKVYL